MAAKFSSPLQYNLNLFLYFMSFWFPAFEWFYSFIMCFCSLQTRSKKEWEQLAKNRSIYLLKQHFKNTCTAILETYTYLHSVFYVCVIQLQVNYVYLMTKNAQHFPYLCVQLMSISFFYFCHLNNQYGSINSWKVHNPFVSVIFREESNLACVLFCAP